MALGLFGSFAASRDIGRLPLSKVVARHASCAAIGIGAALLLLIAYFLLRAGTMPSIGLLTYHIRLFSAGLMALPMPPWGVWIVPLVLYSATFFLGMRGLYATPTKPQAERNRDAALVAMTVFGALTFRYYQGRSHLLILSFISFPAFFCVGLLLDRLLRFYGRLRGSVIRQGIVACLFGPLLAGLLMHAQAFQTLSRPWLLGPLTHWTSPLELKMNAINAEFEKIRHSPDDTMLVMAPYSAEMMLASGKPSTLHVDGMCQMWRKKDGIAIIRNFEDQNTKMVVFESDPSGSCANPLAYVDQAIPGIVDRYFVVLPMPDLEAKEPNLKVLVRR